ncbi:MAG: DUF3179 domain-containing protein [Acidimicrobiia bacterium]|nr:DUF3179 domain-containing protein [Acidimicrobiia bacterium]
MKPMRFVSLIAALGLIAVACGGAETDSTVASTSDELPTTSSGSSVIPAQTAFPEGPSALDDASAEEFPEPLVDVSQIISGGPPPDGIPPIDDPEFLDVADHLDLYNDNAPVVALEINGDARAYPAAVMIWHEIVNDTVGGVPVTVTYCPLCNSAVTYGREINGSETTFGTSGRLFASALVMYDRATESMWTHFDGRAVVGLLTGTQLDVYGSPLMAWSEFRTIYPNGLVLDETKTGHSRDYGANPYVGYDDPDSSPFLFFGDLDSRARAKERVVGISLAGVDAAYSLRTISGTGDTITVTEAAQGDTDFVIFWAPGQATALEGPSVQFGRDVGTVGAFIPRAGDTSLTFTADEEGFVDAETGTKWSVAGVALSGELAGASLERIPHLDTFWFAWSTYRPGSELVGDVG